MTTAEAAGLFPFGFLNNETVSNTNDIYVNADRRNVIYEFSPRDP